MRTRVCLDYTVIVVVALGVRLWHAYYVAQTPFFNGPVIDAFVYRSFARHIAQTGDFGGAFYQPPLYPAFLALLFRCGLHSAWSLAIVQSTLGAATTVLVAHNAERLCQHRGVAFAAGLATALYGPLVLFDVELLPPCCVDLLFAAAVSLSLRAGPFGLPDLLLGLVMGLGIVAWPPTAAFFPTLLWLRKRHWQLPRFKQTLVVLACAAIPLTFTARHNAEHGGGGVVVSYNLGINLWLGNNPAWRDTWRARPGAEFEPQLERPDREGVTNVAARSSYFTRAVLVDLRAHPWNAVTRSAEKLYYAFYGREIRRDNDVQSLRQASPVLRALLWEQGLLFPFGLVAPLALLGAWRRRNEAVLRAWIFGVVSYAAVLAVFFVSSRYRLPLALVLLPLAAEQAFWLAQHRPRLPALAFAALLLLLNWPNAFTETFAASPAERGTLRAQALRNGGNSPAATTLSAELVQLFPQDTNVRLLRAEQLLDSGRCREAEPQLRHAVKLAPRTATPRLLLAECLDGAAAEREYANVLALHPYHPIALKQVGALYLQNHRPREAQAVLARFVAAGYQDAEVSGWLRGLTGASE